jgi:hypothetical protein
MRFLAILALVVAVVLGLVGLVRMYTFEKDPLGYAEGVCPAPPNRVDSAERQACLRDYEETKSGMDIAGSQLLGSIALLLGGVVLLVASRRHRDDWDPPTDDAQHSSATRGDASGPEPEAS